MINYKGNKEWQTSDNTPNTYISKILFLNRNMILKIMVTKKKKIIVTLITIIINIIIKIIIVIKI